MDLWGVRIVGLNAETARRALLTFGAIVVVLLLRAVLRGLARVVLDGRRRARAQFWTRQAINLFCAAAATIFTVSIWFDDPHRLTTAAGMVTAAARHAITSEQLDAESQHRLRERYHVELTDISPRVFLRITDNWLEMGLRFLVPDRGIREIKDAITRDVLRAFEEARIHVASATYDITVTQTAKT